MALRALCKRASVVVIVSTMVFVPFVSSADEAAPAESSGGGCITADKCCRVCSAGKACGNSCIQATKTCHKGRGCACNEAELCSGS